MAVKLLSRIDMTVKVNFIFLFLLFSFTCVSTARADISLTNCKQTTALLTTGMSRTEIEKKGFTYDGGVNGILKNTRMMMGAPPSNMGPSKLCMVYVDFRPKDISDADYTDADRFAAWIRARKDATAPDDVAVKIGEPFLDSYHWD
jgi:hypothetical protein